jgi:hypothetical protein
MAPGGEGKIENGTAPVIPSLDLTDIQKIISI